MCYWPRVGLAELLAALHHQCDTLAMRAARCDRRECLQVLAELVSDLHHAAETAPKPALTSSDEGDAGCLEWLVGHGVDLIRAMRHGATAGPTAAKSGSLGCLRPLARGAADLHQTAEASWTPLRMAISHGPLPLRGLAGS